MHKQRDIQLPGNSGVRAFAISNDNCFLAVSQYGAETGDVLLSLFDMLSFKLIKKVEQYNDNSILSPAFSSNNTYLLYSKDDYIINIFDLSTLAIVDSIETSLNKKIISSRQSEKIICSGKYLEVWDLTNNEIIYKIDSYESFRIADAGSLDVSSASWYHKAEFMPFTTEPAVACFNPANDTEIFYTGVNDPRIFKLNIISKTITVLIKDGVLQANDMQISNNGKLIAVSSRIPAGNFVWSTTTGERVAADVISDKYNSASSVHFHPVNNWLVMGSLVGYITVIDLASTDIVYSEKIHHLKVNQVQFINEGTQILSASDDGRLTITDIS